MIKCQILHRLKKIVVYRGFFGVLFLLLSLICIDDKLTAFCFFSIALLLIPPIRNFVYVKTNKSLSRDARVITIFALIIISLTSIVQTSTTTIKTKHEEDKVAKEKADIDYFNKNKENILTDLKSNNKRKDYQKSVALASRYLPSKNEELLSLYGIAKKEISKEKIKEIKLIINKTPKNDFSKMLEHYEALSSLDPNNQDYLKKVESYLQKISAQNAEKLLLEAQAEIQAEQEKLAIEEYEEKWGGKNGNKDASMSSMKIISQRFYKAMMQPVALVDITIKNNGQRDIKDITLHCKHYANSGTLFHGQKAYLLELIKAGQTLSYKGLNIGDIYQQTTQINCTIEDLEIIPN